MNVRFHSITIPKPGETANGDAVVVRPGDACSLFGVVDGLGHGPRAEQAAQAAVAAIEAVSLEASMTTIIAEIDRQLRGTRGAAAMVCRFTGGRLEGCGIGNVELRAHPGRVPAVLTPGILGSRVRSPRVFEAGLEVGQRLLLFSDGLRSGIAMADFRDFPLPKACDMLLQRYRRGHDDATVLLAEVTA